MASSYLRIRRQTHHAKALQTLLYVIVALLVLVGFVLEIFLAYKAEFVSSVPVSMRVPALMNSTFFMLYSCDS